MAVSADGLFRRASAFVRADLFDAPHYTNSRTGKSALQGPRVPYRIDILNASDDAFDRLVELGAIDAEALPGGGFAAIMPDRVEASQVEQALGTNAFSIAPVTGRDADSVWLVSPRPIRVGRLQMLPAHREPEPGAVRLIDSAAFGTGLHPTTVLCLESLQEIVQIAPVDAVLDVGTGSGVLALGALALGVPRALGIDISDEALRVAAANARLNGMGQRLELRRGGPDRLSGRWPLVVANVLPAALIEMAPASCSASAITANSCCPASHRHSATTWIGHTVALACDARS